jgi:hypothetical protein
MDRRCGAVFAIHWIAESAWERPYSSARNNISDLGNTHCAMQQEPEPRYICSLEHGLMNTPFIVLGTLLVVGVALTGPMWRRGAPAAIARFLLAGAGLRFALAGLAPADVHENQHVLGALLIMGTGKSAFCWRESACRSVFRVHCAGPPPCRESRRSWPWGSSFSTTTRDWVWEVWSGSRRLRSCVDAGCRRPRRFPSGNP